jgi:hypothetical protein
MMMSWCWLHACLSCGHKKSECTTNLTKPDNKIAFSNAILLKFCKPLNGLVTKNIDGAARRHLPHIPRQLGAGVPVLTQIWFKRGLQALQTDDPLCLRWHWPRRGSGMDFVLSGSNLSRWCSLSVDLKWFSSISDAYPTAELHNRNTCFLRLFVEVSLVLVHD